MCPLSFIGKPDLRSKGPMLQDQHCYGACLNLGFDCVLRSALEGLVLVVLLQGTEKRVDLPTLLLDVRNRYRTPGSLICEEVVENVLLFIPDRDPTDRWKNCFFGFDSKKLNFFISVDF